MMKIATDSLPFDLYICAIAPGERGTRRRRENTAVAQLVSEIFGADAQRLNDASGAPYIAVAGHRILPSISISHSTTMCAIAVAKNCRSIGLDIETARPQLERVASRIFTSDELAIVPSLLHGWTAKEALYKAGRHLLAGEPEYKTDIRLDSPCRGTIADTVFALKYYTIEDNSIICVAYA